MVAATLGAASSTPEPGRVYNVGCGSRVSLNELLRKIGRVTGCEVIPEYRPAKAGDVRDSLADISAARRDLGYEPRISLEQGLAQLVEATRMPVAA